MRPAKFDMKSEKNRNPSDSKRLACAACHYRPSIVTVAWPKIMSASSAQTTAFTPACPRRYTER